MRLLTAFLALLPVVALAQTAPTMPKTGVNAAGRPATSDADISNVLSSKVDVTNGHLTSPVITGGTISGAAITGSSIPGLNTANTWSQTQTFTGGFSADISPSGVIATGGSASISEADRANFVIDVRDYGAKCDGSIVYGGVVTSAGSKIVTTPSHAFTTADVGATITLSIAPFNSFTASALSAFTSTIVSVSSGAATMAANSTITTSAGQAFWYHTVDTAALQAAETAANAHGGGIIRYPAAVCVTGNLTFYSGSWHVGQGQQATTIALANGSNSDLFTGSGFGILQGTNGGGGVHDFAFKDMQLYGNRAANTGSGIGTATGTGDGIRFYGYQFTTDNLLLNYFAADGWYSEWAAVAGNPIDINGNIGVDDMLAHPHDIKGAYNAGYAMAWAGPHDSLISHLDMFSNGTGGFIEVFNGADSNGSPLRIDHAHGYQEGGQDFIFWGSVNCDQCYAELSMWLRAYNYSIIDSGITTLVMGTGGGGPAYGLHMTNTVVGTLVDTNGGGFQDYWVNSSVSAVTGGTYSPFGVFNTPGLTSVAQNEFDVLAFGAFPSQFKQNGASLFEFDNQGATQYTNNGPAGTKFFTPLLWTTAGTATNCSSSASPAVCGAAAGGSVAIPTGTNPTLVVNSSAVTANSQILVTVDESLGTKLSVTCNTTLASLPHPVVTARTAATSFTIQIAATIATNPVCVSYLVVN